MCLICSEVGLSRECVRCGGFDWVEDVYRREQTEARLCLHCLIAWRDVMAHTVV